MSTDIRTGNADGWDSLRNEFADPVRFWLRIEPAGFTPISPAGQITRDDPPRTAQGSTYIQLDTNRRLKEFYRQPPTMVSEPPKGTPEWAIPFRLAGLDIENFQPIDARRNAGTPATTRQAWTGTTPDPDNDSPGHEPLSIDVFAAAYGDTITEFAILPAAPQTNTQSKPHRESQDDRQSQSDNAPKSTPTPSDGIKPARQATHTGSAQPEPQQDSTETPEATTEADRDARLRTATLIQSIARWIVLLMITLVAAVLAYRNIRLKKSDTRRAIRVGVAIFLLTSLTAILSVDSYARAMGLLFGPFPLYSLGLGLSLIAATCYIAVEPLARSRWPDSLVSWTRLFSGGFRDPMIGRDILIGTTAGSTIIALTTAAQFAAPRLTDLLGPDAIPPTASDLTIVFDGTKAVVAQILATIASGFLNASAIAVLVILVMLGFQLIRVRSRWPALITVALLSGAQSLASPNAGLADRVALIISNILVIILLDRVGLLATAIAVITASTLTIFINAAPYDQWWATAGITPAVAVAALLIFGYRTATTGRSLFGSP